MRPEEALMRAHKSFMRAEEAFMRPHKGFMRAEEALMRADKSCLIPQHAPCWGCRPVFDSGRQGRGYRPVKTLQDPDKIQAIY